MSSIRVTQDDILVRASFDAAGALEGYFALRATDFAGAAVRPSEGELRATPQEAVATFLEDLWPEIAAEAFGRNWIASRAGGFNGGIAFDELVDALSEAFPSLSRKENDQSYAIARKCEMEWSRQQRQRKANGPDPHPEKQRTT